MKIKNKGLYATILVVSLGLLFIFPGIISANYQENQGDNVELITPELSPSSSFGNITDDAGNAMPSSPGTGEEVGDDEGVDSDLMGNTDGDNELPDADISTEQPTESMQAEEAQQQSSGTTSKRALGLGRSLSGLPDSIGGISLAAADKTKICVIPGTSGAIYDAYTASEAGLKEALFSIYTKNNGADYIIYIGASVASNTPGTHVGRLGPAAPANSSEMTLSALEGRVGAIGFVGHATDSKTTGTTTPAGASALSLSTDPAHPIYAGTDILFRNVYYEAGTVFMNGYSLTLGNGSAMRATSDMTIYGGSESGDVAAVGGSNSIVVQSAGSMKNFTIYGGNKVGSFTGDTTITMGHSNGGAGSTLTVYGGNEDGTNHGSSTTHLNGILDNLAVKAYGGSKAGQYEGDTAMHYSAPVLAGSSFDVFAGSAGGTHVGNTVLYVSPSGAAASANLYGGNEAGTHRGTVTLQVISAANGNVIFGGNKAGRHEGHVQINAQGSMGTGDITIYGGNEDGEFEGDVRYTLHKLANGANNKLVMFGGSKAGAHTGNVNISTQDTLGNIIGNIRDVTIYGGNDAGVYAGNTSFAMSSTNSPDSDIGSLTYYGGSKSATHTGDSTIALRRPSGKEVYGNINMYVYGGNESGTHRGNAKYTINCSPASIRTLAVFGGSKAGTHVGDASFLMERSTGASGIGSAETMWLYGGNEQGESSGNVSIDFNHTNGGTYLYTYGGAKDGKHTGDTTYTLRRGTGSFQLIDGAKYMYLFGGNENGEYKGKVTYNIGCTNGNTTVIYGGSADGITEADVTYNITETGTAGTQKFFGGSKAGTHTGASEFNITKMHIGHKYIYGGNETGSHNGAVNINVIDTYTGDMSIYGGNDAGEHTGNVAVDITTMKALSTANIAGGNRTGNFTGDVRIDLPTTGTARALTLYGGSVAGSFKGNADINIGTTNAATPVNISGGNGQGSFEGNVDLDIVALGNGTVANITGGSLQGDLKGDVDTNIGSTGSVTTVNYYGGGVGTVAASKVGGVYPYTGRHEGNITTLITDTGSTNVLNFIGGSKHGDITGSVSSVIELVGPYTSPTIIGGIGVIGSVGGDVSTTIKETDNSTATLTIFGGGKGESADKKANVGGSVATRVEIIRCALDHYYGGVKYGDIGGTVSNYIANGDGVARFAHALTEYVGGSSRGNIGTPAGKGTAQAIMNEIDLSAFASHSRALHFTGANEYSGFIYGKILNDVTAGNYNQGMIDGYNGGGAKATANASGTNKSNITQNTTTKKTSINSAAIEAASAFRVYGDIENHLRKGCFSGGGDSGYARAAGYGGYIEGNVTITLGEDGLAYGLNNTKYTDKDIAQYYASSQTRADNSKGHDTAWDVVAGGGITGSAGEDSIYIKGDTTLIHMNSLARWTYGGGFGGVIEGNTTAKLYKGIVDTLEGGGYWDYLIKGNSHAYVENGQVDYFLTGGGWNDVTIDGNASLLVMDGNINGSVSGNYANHTYCTLTGDSSVLIKGGDFSGKNRAGVRAFVGGTAAEGALLGNVTLTLDFRNLEGRENVKFGLPSLMYISGGRPAGDGFEARQNSVLGLTADNWVEVNIFTNEGNDWLAGAHIYGDGGGGTDHAVSSANALKNSVSGKIRMNIDAPGSTIGSLYATSYDMATTSGLQKDVEINLVDADLVGGISCGSPYDDFTNSIVSKNSNKAVLNIGYYKDGDAREGSENTIKVGDNGFCNFTHMNVSDTLLMVDSTTATGSIRNGKGVDSATKHKDSYSAFGDVLLENGGGIGINGNNTAPYISIGKLTVKGEARLVSPAGENRVWLTSFASQRDEDNIDGLLRWDKNNAGTLHTHTGKWFGSRPSYRVLTFTDGGTNAEAVTPHNFVGYSPSDGKTFIGDNNSTQYSLAVPGSFIEADVKEGRGDVRHNVNNVKDGSVSTDLPLQVFGTVEKDTPVQSFRLAIPQASNPADTIYPTVKFTPELTDTESWVKRVLIESTQLVEGSEKTEERPERPDGLAESWTSTDGSYSYTLGGWFTNQAEISARNIIICESDAAALLTANDVIALNEAKGRPFFGYDIDEATLDALHEPLNGLRHRVHTIDYRAGKMDDNKTSTVANIVIVPDADTNISTDGHAAIFAQDAAFNTKTAQTLTAAQLNETFTKALYILSDGTVSDPGVEASYMAAINGATLSKVVDVTYAKGSGDSAVSITVKVNILGDDMVCKIKKTGYKSLHEAIVAANAMATSGEIKIEMLVDSTHDKASQLLDRSNVVITTADKADPYLPYRGSGNVARVTFMPATEGSGNFITLSGSALKLAGVVFDGAGTDEYDGSLLVADSSKLVLGEGSVVEGFSLSRPLIVNNSELLLQGAAVRNNSTTAPKGTLHNTASHSMVVEDSSITGNKAADGAGIYNEGALSVKNSSITGNLVQGGGSLYNGGELTLSGKVILHGNKVGADIATGKQANLYIDGSSTTTHATALKLNDALTADSEVGVMTDTSTSNGGRGVLYTIIGTGDTGALKASETVFTHDQLDVNGKAYQVHFDQRQGGDKLVLGYLNAVHFVFTTVDARDTNVVLPDTEFTLYECKQEHTHTGVVTKELVSAGGCWQPVKDGEEIRKHISDENGVADFGALANGRYMLVQANAPNGFSKPYGQWKLKIDNTQPGYQRIDIVGVGEMLPPAFARTPKDADNELLLLPQIPTIAIAPTGGAGIYTYYLLGAVIIAIAFAVLMVSRRVHPRKR